MVAVKTVQTDPNLPQLFSDAYGGEWMSWQLTPRVDPQLVIQAFEGLAPEITSLLLWRYQLIRVARVLKMTVPKVPDEIAPLLEKQRLEAVQKLAKSGSLATLACAVRR